MNYPPVKDPKMVGTYPALSKSGAGYFYDDVLEYRVWVHPQDDEVYYHAFSNYEEALVFSRKTENAEQPLVLVYQIESINEPEEGKFIHVKEPRITEWKPEWLEGTKGTIKLILLFLKEKRIK